MKKIFIYLTGIMAIAIASVSLLTQDTRADRSTMKTEQELRSIFEKFGDDAIFSFFSLEELRPFSILQFDKTLEIYENKWIPPQKYMEKLDSREKEYLIEKITGYLNSLGQDNSERIVQKVKRWCTIQDQLGLLTDDMEVNERMLLETFNEIEATKPVFAGFAKNGEVRLDQLNEEERKEAFIKTMNTIANLNNIQQFDYYSQMFNKLYLASK